MAERDLGPRGPMNNIPAECQPDLGIAQPGVSEYDPYRVNLDDLTITRGGSWAARLAFKCTIAVLTVQGIDYKKSGRQITLKTRGDLYEAFLAQRIFSGPADSLIRDEQEYRGSVASFFLL